MLLSFILQVNTNTVMYDRMEGDIYLFLLFSEQIHLLLQNSFFNLCSSANIGPLTSKTFVMSKQRHLKERIPTDVSTSHGAVGLGRNLFAICVKILITAFLGHACLTIWPLRFLGFCVTENSCPLSELNQGITYVFHC